MMNPVTVMKMLGERKTFIANHPEFFGFVIRVFAAELPPGTVVELRVTEPEKDAQNATFCVAETDRELLEKIREMLR